MYAHRCIQLLEELKWTQSQVFGKLTALEGVVKISSLMVLDGDLSTQLFAVMGPGQMLLPRRCFQGEVVTQLPTILGISQLLLL